MEIMQPGWRRNMLKLVLIIGIPVIASFFFYKKLAFFYVTDPGFGVKMQHVYEPGQAPYYLFLGSSRVIHHIDPRVIDSVTGKTSYNLGISGFRIVEMRMFLNVFIARHKLPHVVVINIDGGTFNVRQPAWIFTDILTYASTDPVVRHSMAEYQDVYACRWKYPFYRLQNYMSVNDGFKVWALWKSKAAMDRQVAQMNKPDEAAHPDGFAPLHGPYIEMYLDPYHEVFEEEGIGVLRDMIDLCRRNGIKVILLTSPYYKDYDSLLVNSWQVFRRTKQVADGLGVPYINMHHDSMFSDRSNYYDMFHLNAGGAEKFSIRLGKILCDY